MTTFVGTTFCIWMLAAASLVAAWTPPPAKDDAAHPHAADLGESTFYDTTGVRCDATTGAQTAPYGKFSSDGKASPQTRVRCHTPSSTSKPWYWCEQYGRPMDVMFLLDSSMSIGNKWKNLMKVVEALLEGMETTVYPNVQCDEDYRANGGTCKFRMGMQMWGFSNSNDRLCGKQNCVNDGTDWTCTPNAGKDGNHRKCKKNLNAKTLPCYYPDATIPLQNQISNIRPENVEYLDNTCAVKDNGVNNNCAAANANSATCLAASTGNAANACVFTQGVDLSPIITNNWLPHMHQPQSPTRDKSEFRGWADTRNPDEWTDAVAAGFNANQVGYLRYVAKDWHDNWYDCFPRTQWTKPFLDCLYSVRKENPLANQEADALRMCIMVTDGAPWRDKFPDGNDNNKNAKWSSREVKKNGIQTVGVYLQTGGNKKAYQSYTYCISSCYDKTQHGKDLGNDSEGVPWAYNFDKCSQYLAGAGSQFNAYLEACEYYIDGNVQSASDYVVIKGKVDTLINAIAADAYTVSTQNAAVLSCKWDDGNNADGVELCQNNRCLQVNREAWVCWKGHEQGSDASGATTCTKCKPGHFRAAYDGGSFCTTCGSGKFMPFEGGTGCSTCPTGQYTGACVGQSDPGCACISSLQPGCSGVTIGTCPHEGCVRCKNCPLGYYGGTLNDNGGGTNNYAAGAACDKCGAGFYGGGGTETSCTQCDKGTFSDSKAFAECTDCPNGKYEDQLGQTSCKACDYGQIGMGEGRQSCLACPAGQHSVDPGIAGCVV